MSRPIAEHSNNLSIFWLKKHGYLPTAGSCLGNITWTHGDSHENSIWFTVTTYSPDNWYENSNIRLQYTRTSHWTGRKEDVDSTIMLTTTPCYFGGVRYWFVCPLTKDGQYCGKRVGVIYGIDKYFGCRHCGDIVYDAQTNGGRFRGNVVSIPDIEQAEEDVKRYYYNGRPTRKYRRLIRLSQKFEKNFIRVAGLVAGLKK